MKTNQNTNRVVISDSVKQENTTEFSIAQSSHMMKILSENLYSDRILAVCREICCNALDIHNRVKSPVPFEVTVPSTWSESEFVVKDYGTGLTDEEFKRVFITYGGSDKGNSNDEIGGFGLGSKSPFAYSDTFSVESRSEIQGTVNTFFLFKNKQGIPVANKVDSREFVKGKDKKGITVRVPVAEKDIQAFQTKAKKILYFFPAGSFELHGESMEGVFGGFPEGKDWVIAKHERTGQSGHIVLMGNVPYSIPVQSLNSEDAKNLLKEIQGPLILRFDIGSLSLAPSREALSLDEKTLENLEKALKKVSGDIIKTALDEIEELIPSLDQDKKPFRAIFQYRERASEILEKYGGLSAVDLALETKKEAVLKKALEATGKRGIIYSRTLNKGSKVNYYLSLLEGLPTRKDGDGLDKYYLSSVQSGFMNSFNENKYPHKSSYWTTGDRFHFGCVKQRDTSEEKVAPEYYLLVSFGGTSSITHNKKVNAFIKEAPFTRFTKVIWIQFKEDSPIKNVENFKDLYLDLFDGYFGTFKVVDVDKEVSLQKEKEETTDKSYTLPPLKDYTGNESRSKIKDFKKRGKSVFYYMPLIGSRLKKPGTNAPSYLVRGIDVHLKNFLEERGLSTQRFFLVNKSLLNSSEFQTSGESFVFIDLSEEFFDWKEKTDAKNIVDYKEATPYLKKAAEKIITLSVSLSSALYSNKNLKTIPALQVIYQKDEQTRTRLQKKVRGKVSFKVSSEYDIYKAASEGKISNTIRFLKKYPMAYHLITAGALVAEDHWNYNSEKQRDIRKSISNYMSLVNKK
jgi:hypothetical protein